MSLFNESFDLASNTEIEMLLTELPYNLIKENIRSQVANPLVNNVNYIDNVTDRFRLMQAEFSENEEAMQQTKSFIQNFFQFLIKEIDNRFALEVDLEQLNDAQLVATGVALYDFLILRYKKNIIRYVFKFISKNKKLLVEKFEGAAKQKDVTSNSIKKKVKNKDDALILSNLPNIVKTVLAMEIDPLDFLKYVSNDEYYEANVIKDLIQSDLLNGNFTVKYIELITDEFDYVLDEIQNEVRFKLMKKM